MTHALAKSNLTLYQTNLQYKSFKKTLWEEKQEEHHGPISLT